MTKPNISKIAFWDVNFDKIDFNESSVFVIDKVLNHGTWADIVEIIKYYGLERIKKDAVSVPYFKSSALSFLCLILELNKTDFIAYQRRQIRISNWTC